MVFERCDMKRLLMLLVVWALTVGGCGMVDTYRQRENRYLNITGFQARQAVDDWDYFWLYDRPSRLTEWHLREAD